VVETLKIKVLLIFVRWHEKARLLCGGRAFEKIE